MYSTACVAVRAAAGLAPQYRRPFLKFIYEKPSTEKRVSAKSQEADVLGLDGADTLVASWHDAVVCVPTKASPLTVELWNAFAQHDLFLGNADVNLETSPSSVGASVPCLSLVSLQCPSSIVIEIGPSWVVVATAPYDGVRNRPVNLEIVISYIQTNPLFVPPDTDTTFKTSVADPTFQFKIPAKTIDWSRVAATNVAEIFLLGNADALLELQDDVLFGDTLASLDMVVDKDIEKAFQMCQYSAQYLHSCVDLLQRRCATYVATQDALLEQQRALQHRRDSQKRVLRQLQKQAKECDALIFAYEAVSKTLPPPESTIADGFEIAKASTPLPPLVIQNELSPPKPPLSHPADDVPDTSPSKTPMLMTYEERMEKNRLAKEATRAERIAAEKSRLIQIMAEQAKQREWKETLAVQDQAMLHHRAWRLQVWLRHVTFRRRYRHAVAQHDAAVVLQCLVRRVLAKRRVVARRDEHRQEMQTRAVQVEEQRVQEALRDEQVKLQEAKELEPILRLWSDIQAAFERAARSGTDVFVFFDVHHRGQVDRAAFRTQLKQLGFNVPRPVVRRLIQLIHSRNGVASDRLVVTAEQFRNAFDLTCVDVPPPPPPSDPPVLAAQTNSLSTPPDKPPSLPTPEAAPPSDIHAISQSFQLLRERIVVAAKARFGGGQTFASLRSALQQLFATFDPERTGDVSLADFKSCVQDQLHISIPHWDWIRECFDMDGNGSLSIVEFVAFAFADASMDELGVLGYQLRDAILNRVKTARKETATIEDAVRLVFHSVYRHRDEAPVAEFCHGLAQLHLGFTPTQLSRLVLRLDRDQNHLISLDELLQWLKLRPGRAKPGETASSLSADSAAVKQLRRHLVALAGDGKPEAVKALFEEIDANGSAKLSAAELHGFLATRAPELPLAAVEKAVACMDPRRKSIVSKQSFVAFCLDATARDGDEEVGVLVEQCRAALLTRHGHDVAQVQAWFAALGKQDKVRTGELKRALKAAGTPHLSDHALDAVVRRLDQDASGWITSQEFRLWVSPIRDIEVLLELVETNDKLQAEVDDTRLFATFDLDGNGTIGVEEFHAGLQRYHIHVNRDEAATLLKEFDINGDGVLDAVEVGAMVQHDGDGDDNDAGAYDSDELAAVTDELSFQGATYDEDFE
ncbi:Aste57867_15714 [Aphanomyces stellatus]|uniref:Aste57867_15714 protein n=1 Tax=Aphanomyces stellatus TaxID=120398 RepID=A0A485L3Q1_9STRA|nr:hypothetical protein As57867_015658 [Aphanomyces stellatus]VFT92505.1 Aste57867_15714 [Aphanomyces stellatus]